MDKELLYSFFQGKTTLHEEMRVREWMEASEENRRVFFEERKLFDSLILLTDEKRVASYHGNVFFNKLWIRELGKIAAVIAITLMATFTYQFFTAEDDMMAMQKITVPSGQRINIELSDGTVVWLNSRTSIQYPAAFKGDYRKVRIDGEAYFEVSHNKEKPFIVETTKGDVEVLGTRFNVEAYSDNNSFVTSLMEGSVKVTSEGEQLVLKPDQMACLLDGHLKVAPIEDYNTYRWKEGLICFKNETFPDIMAKFEKCYGVVIKIDNQKVMNYRCSGKFRQSDGIMYALRVLQKDVQFKFERDENNHIIYIK